MEDIVLIQAGRLWRYWGYCV